jgi:hypothetical protein
VDRGRLPPSGTPIWLIEVAFFIRILPVELATERPGLVLRSFAAADLSSAAVLRRVGFQLVATFDTYNRYHLDRDTHADASVVR